MIKNTSMKRAIIIIFAVIITVQVKGQSSGISITGGVGTYELLDLKSYQDVLIERLPVDAMPFEYFPLYTNIRINLIKQHSPALKYGLIYGFSTTGAHANYSDYSGYLNLDQNLSAYQFGATAGYRLLNIDFFITQFELFAYGDIRLGYVRDHVTMNIATTYYYEYNTLKLTSVSPMAEVGLEAMFRIKKISVGVEGGYLFDSGRNFKAGEESQPFSSVSLRPPGDLRSGMSGFRGGLKFVLWFNPMVGLE
ncbi:MAG: hypothetical protein WD052_13015 [Bacteroidales bacterium]